MYVPCDQLEEALADEDPLDLLERGRLSDDFDLRRTLTHARLTGKLADVIYSMDVTGTDFYAHQFKPVVKLMNSVTRGILIADEVGLGKTIEAGLLWTELRTRYKFRRLLVLCPAVLREKWERELRTRFGVEASILDARETLRTLRRNATTRNDGFAIIASLQGLRPHRNWRETGTTHAASELARFLDESQESPPLVDLCIIDEAHYLRNRETMTSQLGRLVRAVSDYMVLLTATPVHLKSGDLYELLALVDEGMFERGQSFGEILEANRPLVAARDAVTSASGERAGLQLHLSLREASQHILLRDNCQLKRLLDEEVWKGDLSAPSHVARIAERLDRINLLGYAVTRTRRRDVEEQRVVREVDAVHVPPTRAEEDFYWKVTKLVREYCMTREVSAAFLEVTPQRQMCSSMPAALRDWQQGALARSEAIDRWSAQDRRPLRSALADRAEELGDLESLWNGDTKYGYLRSKLLEMFEESDSLKVVVFSTYLATLDYLEERLAQDGIETVSLRGSTDDKDETVETFRRSREAHVLLSSEVGSEGIDLQFARVVINYDLPWNPMRVEQRIGRVDRLGQKAPKIHVLNLFYEDTVDARIYTRLFERLRLFKGTLGGLEPVLGEEIRGLRRRLFRSQLTAEQEEQQIDQTRRALEQRRQDEERLESEAAHLTAYGDYILRQVRAARDLHRSISARDLLTYVTDFVEMHYRGSEFHQTDVDDLRFDVSLSTAARFDLADFMKQQNIRESTRLTWGARRAVTCRFENSAVPDRQAREEIISQFHPLVRFVADKMETSEDRSRPAVTVRLTADQVGGRVEPGLYAFSVQRWSVQGLRQMERLYYAAAPFGKASPLEPAEAEMLIVNAASSGSQWLEARGSFELEQAVTLVARECLGPSEQAFRTYISDLTDENEDRATVQTRMAERRFQAQKRVLDEQLQTYLERGPQRLVPATQGRIRALDERAARRHQEIQAARELVYGSPETVCVGVILLED